MSEQAPNIESFSGSGRLVYDKERRTIVSASPEPVAWCGWHPKHGWALQTCGHDQQHAASLLMRTDIAGNHGWSVQPLFAAPPSRVQAVGK